MRKKGTHFCHDNAKVFLSPQELEVLFQEIGDITGHLEALSQDHGLPGSYS
jgi:ribosomal protein S15P/S13E